MKVLTLDKLTYFYSCLMQIIDNLKVNSHSHSNHTILNRITDAQQTNIESLTNSNWAEMKQLTSGDIAGIKERITAIEEIEAIGGLSASDL